jgi:hypothetical protein
MMTELEGKSCQEESEVRTGDVGKTIGSSSNRVTRSALRLPRTRRAFKEWVHCAMRRGRRARRRSPDSVWTELWSDSGCRTRHRYQWPAPQGCRRAADNPRAAGSGGFDDQVVRLHDEQGCARERRRRRQFLKGDEPDVATTPADAPPASRVGESAAPTEQTIVFGTSTRAMRQEPCGRRSRTWSGSSFRYSARLGSGPG